MGTTSFPGAVDDFATTSPTNLGDDDSTGRTHSERHNDAEAAMEAMQTVAPLDRRWIRGGAASAVDDEFRDGSLAGAWTRVDASGGTARATWTEAADSLSLTINGGDAAAELHGLVRAHTLAVGDAIETRMTMHGPAADFNSAGLVLADGNTHGAGVQAYWSRWHLTGGRNQLDAAWATWSSRTAYTDRQTFHSWGDSCHLRLEHDASNSFKFWYSTDGISWVLINTRSITMTPTHVGFACSSYSASTPVNATFDYFRVVTV